MIFGDYRNSSKSKNFLVMPIKRLNGESLVKGIFLQEIKMEGKRTC